MSTTLDAVSAIATGVLSLAIGLDHDRAPSLVIRDASSASRSRR
jgi:hypothetical protein